MLSFEIVPWFKAQAIQIYCDEAGLADLIAALQRVREAGHLHLRAPSGGGTALSEVTPFGEPAITQVIVTVGGD
jgi:hypothetical protein